jgi:hypothetical protein
MVAGLERNTAVVNSSCVSQNHKDCWTLKEAYQLLGGNQPSDIPFRVWLLENPDSPVALPGKIDLYRHDCIHVLLNRGFSLNDEAFVIGLTMGNDTQTNWLHISLFKFFSMLFYPKIYKFTKNHLKSFDLGISYGRTLLIKNLNYFNFKTYQNHTIDELRKLIGIDTDILKTIDQAEEVL